MTVCVLLFAAHREAVGSSRTEIDIPDGSTLDDLYEYLQSQYHRLRELRSFTTFAVNREVVDSSSILHGGDEVALLQPVSGGQA